MASTKKACEYVNPVKASLGSIGLNVEKPRHLRVRRMSLNGESTNE